MPKPDSNLLFYPGYCRWDRFVCFADSKNPKRWKWCLCKRMPAPKVWRWHAGRSLHKWRVNYQNNYLQNLSFSVAMSCLINFPNSGGKNFCVLDVTHAFETSVLMIFFAETKSCVRRAAMESCAIVFHTMEVKPQDILIFSTFCLHAFVLNNFYCK